MDNYKKTFRISYTLLSLWSKGAIDEAISVYFHLDGKKSPQMTDGLRLHKLWQKDILLKKSLKIGRTTLIFNTPRVEFGENGELNKPYNDLWDVGGRFDCLDGTILYEFKSGIKDALDHAGDYQIPFYFLLAELSGIKIEKAYLLHFNQYVGRADLVIIHNSPTQIERARNYIDTLAYPIYEYFNKNGLL